MSVLHSSQQHTISPVPARAFVSEPNVKMIRFGMRETRSPKRNSSTANLAVDS